MLLLEAYNIKKFYGDRLIINLDELSIYSGEKIGIIGQNGSGKTTLLNILSGQLEPDTGFVKNPCEFAYIKQLEDESINTESQLLGEFNLSNKLNPEFFSGGEKTRLKIANALSNNNLLLFADEPTANLDYQGIEILRKKLYMIDSFLLISHDRHLLDDLCNKIFEVKNGKITVYNGNYSAYKAQLKIESDNAEKEYEKYISEKEKLTTAIKDRSAKAKKMRKAPKRMGNSEARLHTRRSNEKREKLTNAANSLKTRLEKLEIKEKPHELIKIKLNFALTDPPHNKIVISADNLSFAYSNKKIFNDAKFKIYNGSKTALWGKNGSGKTTLMNLISQRISNSNINIVPKAKIGYFYQGFENLDLNKTVIDNLLIDSIQSETVVRTILARLLIPGDNVYKKVNVLSGGERIKVSFAKLLVSDLNILMLDEPTNYLDMLSIEAVEKVLSDYEGTVLFVSHDKSFINSVANRLLIFNNMSVTEFAGNLNEFSSNKNKFPEFAQDTTEKLTIQMQMTEVVAKLAKADANKEQLEAEYDELISKLAKFR